MSKRRKGKPATYSTLCYSFSHRSTLSMHFSPISCSWRRSIAALSSLLPSRPSCPLFTASRQLITALPHRDSFQNSRGISRASQPRLAFSSEVNVCTQFTLLLSPVRETAPRCTLRNLCFEFPVIRELANQLIRPTPAEEQETLGPITPSLRRSCLVSGVTARRSGMSQF